MAHVVQSFAASSAISTPPLGVPLIIGIVAVAFVTYSVLWWIGYEQYEYADEQEELFQSAYASLADTVDASDADPDDYL